MNNALKKVEFINCKLKAPKLGRILCKSSFSPSNSNSGVKNCGKSFACCQYIKQGTEHTFETVDEIFEIRMPVSCESKNLIYVEIFSCRKEEYIGQTQTMFKERLNTYRQHMRQPQLQQIDVEGHIKTCAGRNYAVFCNLGRRQNLKKVI